MHMRLDALIEKLEPKGYDEIGILTHGHWDDEYRHGPTGTIAMAGDPVPAGEAQAMVDAHAGGMARGLVAACFYSDTEENRPFESEYPYGTLQVSAMLVYPRLDVDTPGCRITLDTARISVQSAPVYGYGDDEVRFANEQNQ